MTTGCSEGGQAVSSGRECFLFMEKRSGEGDLYFPYMENGDDRGE